MNLHLEYGTDDSHSLYECSKRVPLQHCGLVRRNDTGLACTGVPTLELYSRPVGEDPVRSMDRPKHVVLSSANTFKNSSSKSLQRRDSFRFARNMIPTINRVVNCEWPDFQPHLLPPV
jgi:hypothetical protein